ncbi:chitinase [Chlamydoabsidia padenii]|nr:chitinase [Chlamydoabsidia padenii]
MVDKSTIIRLALLTPVVLFLLYFGWFQNNADLDNGHWDTSSPPATAKPAKPSPILAGYFPAWSIYDRNYNVKDIDAEKLSHILYAFANVNETGAVDLGDAWADTDKHFEKEQTVNNQADRWTADANNLYGNFKQLYRLKRKYRHLKVSLSIGGWSWSTNFASVAMDEIKRERFAISAAQHVANLGLDGIDIDWEFPKTTEEGEAFVALLKQVRSALDTIQPSYLLSVALGCGPDNYKHLELTKMNKHVDIFYLMSYDLAGAWDPTTGHQAALYGTRSVDKAIQHFAQHVPKHKLVMGLPVYGRSYSDTDGPRSTFNGVPEGTWEKGSYDYKALPRPGADEVYDATMGVSWSYDAQLREYVTYDNHQVVEQKAHYVVDQGLGGCMFWELSADTERDDPRHLLSAAFRGLGGRVDDTKNHLSYPDSQYDNIRLFAD